MKFKKVELNAFRAYRNSENGTFDFTLNDDGKIANFISIYAPNGFGKTSFYDGVEWALTRNIRRFKNRANDAKAEREQDEDLDKQFVLQHKGIDIAINRGYVNIETTKGNYREQINKISSSQTADYVFNKRTINNKFFQDVLLSQDGIDSFLNADDDKERYKKFLNYFGDNGLEKYHENIKKLEEQNKKEKDQKNEKIDEINEILKEPIDEKVFEFTNKRITEIQNLGCSLEIIGNDFNETKKLQFEENLIEQKGKLVKNFESQKMLIDKLPLWLEDSEKYFKNKTKSENEKKELKDYEELHKTEEKIQFLNVEIEKNKNKKVELEQLKNIFPIYKIINNDLEVKQNELKNVKFKLDYGEKNLNQITLKNSTLSKQIELTEQNKNQLINLLQTVPKIYEDIKNSELEIKKEREKLEFQQKLFDRYQTDIKSFNEETDRLSLTIESIKNDIFIDIDSEEKYKLDLQTIEFLIKDNDLKKEELKTIKTKREEYKQYNEQLKKLLSSGISLIDERQTDTCPLCNTKQDSYEILKNKVLNSPFLNEVEKDLLEESEKINYSIKTNDKKIYEIKNSIILDFNKKLKELDAKLTKTNFEIEKINLDFLKKEISKLESSLVLLKNKVENHSEDKLKILKTEEISSLEKKLAEYYKEKNVIENSTKVKQEEIELLKININQLEQDNVLLKEKEEYKLINDFILSFEQKIDIEKVLNDYIESHNTFIQKSKENLKTLENKFTSLLKQYNIINIDEIMKIIEELKDKIFKLSTEIHIFETTYEQYFKNKIDNQESVKEDTLKKQTEIEESLKVHSKSIEIIETLEKSTTNLLKFIESKNKEKELENYKKELEKKEKVSNKIASEKKQLETKIEEDVKSFFHEELINQIYSKIDPHPEFKKVKFKCSFENGIGKLNVYVKDEENNKHISPSLYYSTAQLNVLSLSIFLAKALNTKDDSGNNVNCIFIDDPVQSMDSINILATIDLFRSLVSNYDKQIILSTHDENFHKLLEKKIPKEYFDSKFIELETFGKVKGD